MSPLFVTLFNTLATGELLLKHSQTLDSVSCFVFAAAVVALGFFRYDKGDCVYLKCPVCKIFKED